MTSTPHPARFESEATLFGAYFALYQRLTREADRALLPFGISSRQWLLLAVVARHFPDGAPTLTEVARTYGTSRQNVRRLAEQLEAKGYVRLLEHTDGVRRVCIELTEEVAAFDTPEALDLEGVLFAQLFGHLSGDDLATMNRLVASCLERQDASPHGARA